jgi:hypothetical protein
VSEGAGVNRVDLPGKLFRIEAGLRELAASGRVPSREELESWIIELNDAAYMCSRVLLGELGKSCEALRDAAQALSNVHNALHNQVLSVRMRMEELLEADGALASMEGKVKRVTGRPCRWGRHLGEERLRYTMLINDAAACVHVLAQYLLEKWPEREEGRCAIAKDAEPEAVEVCREWNRYADALSAKRYYHSSDAGSLRGFVVDGKVQLRVGSAEGHLAEIDVRSGVVRYYDTDIPVNRVMGELMAEYAGGRCREYDPEEGGGVEKPSLVCKVRDVRKAARVLAFATSMDFRIGDRKMGIIEGMERECVEYELADHLGFSPEEVERWRSARRASRQE